MVPRQRLQREPLYRHDEHYRSIGRSRDRLREGCLAGSDEPGKVTYTYNFDNASFPGTVIAGHYVVQPATAVGADIALYLKPGHENLAVSYGETAAKILAFYSDVFGPLPSAHLDIVEIGDDTVGGYTAPGVVALASRAFTNPVNYRLLAHEISHLVVAMPGESCDSQRCVS